MPAAAWMGLEDIAFREASQSQKDTHSVTPPLWNTRGSQSHRDGKETVVAGSRGKGNGELVSDGDRVSVLQDENILETCCTTKWIYLILLDCASRNGWGSKLYATFFPGGIVVKNPPANAGDARAEDSVPGKMPWRRRWQPIPVFLPGKSHGQRSWRAAVHGVTKSQTWLSTHTMFGLPQLKIHF